MIESTTKLIELAPVFQSPNEPIKKYREREGDNKTTYEHVKKKKTTDDEEEEGP